MGRLQEQYVLFTSEPISPAPLLAPHGLSSLGWQGLLARKLHESISLCLPGVGTTLCYTFKYNSFYGKRDWITRYYSLSITKDRMDASRRGLRDEMQRPEARCQRKELSVLLTLLWGRRSIENQPGGRLRVGMEKGLVGLW